MSFVLSVVVSVFVIIPLFLQIILSGNVGLFKQRLRKRSFQIRLKLNCKHTLSRLNISSSQIPNSRKQILFKSNLPQLSFIWKPFLILGFSILVWVIKTFQRNINYSTQKYMLFAVRHVHLFPQNLIKIGPLIHVTKLKLYRYVTKYALLKILKEDWHFFMQF